jgi:DNA-directed RNA polymerase specialized sigma24 family protein
MPEVEPKELERAYARALAYARSRVRDRSWNEAGLDQELAQEAMLSSFDPARYPWKGDKPLDHHVVLVVKSLLSDRARAAKVRRDPKRAAAADEAMKRPALPADALLGMRDRQSRRDARVEWVLSQLSGLARDVFLLYLDDVFEARAQADLLGKSIHAVYEARRRVAEVLRSTPAEPESSPELAPSGGDEDDDDASDPTGTDDEAES